MKQQFITTFFLFKPFVVDVLKKLPMEVGEIKRR